jgi:hypothetical protein
MIALTANVESTGRHAGALKSRARHPLQGCQVFISDLVTGLHIKNNKLLEHLNILRLELKKERASHSPQASSERSRCDWPRSA